MPRTVSTDKRRKQNALALLGATIHQPQAEIGEKNCLTYLLFCTFEFHCFADGNKRLTITLSAQFFYSTGI
jgi:hypothetical protein